MIGKLKYVYLVAVPSLILGLAVGLPGTSKSAVADSSSTSGMAAGGAPIHKPLASSVAADPASSAAPTAVGLPLAGYSAREERLLDQIRSDAFQVREHADVMKSLIRFPADYHWMTHAFELTQIREGVNEMGRNLSNLRSTGSSSAVRAARSLIPLQASLVEHTEEAIRFTGKRTFANFWDSGYKGHVDGIYGRANQIAFSVKEFTAQ